jgi:peptide/nickel transport system permease protein
MSILKKVLKNNENLYYAFSNKKVIFGLVIFSAVILLAIIGPMITPYGYEEYAGVGYQSPSKDHFFGTTLFGQDVFTRTVHGLRMTLKVGFFAGSIAAILGCVIGFISGYYSGTLLDEGLMMITNLFLTLPTIPLIVTLTAFMEYRGMFILSLLVGVTNWPWVARAVRSQTLAIKNTEYVNLSKISSVSVFKIIRQDVAANMFSYVFMVFIILFQGTILAAVGLEFLGLGPTRGISLGLVIRTAVNWNAVELGMWWWAILPGAVLTILIISLYFVNTGLDQVFNPRLREM